MSPPNAGDYAAAPTNSSHQMNGSRDRESSASPSKEEAPAHFNRKFNEQSQQNASTRGRSGTVNINTNTSFASSFPQEYMASPASYHNNAHNYDGSARSSVATTASASGTGTSATSDDSASTTTKSFHHGSQSSISRRGPAPPSDMEKRNSLNRSSAARSSSKGSVNFARRGSGLQRQGLVGQRDSVASNASSAIGGVVSEYLSQPDEHDGHVAEGERRGVELVDRPMDD